jgi:hypothetical protein
MHLLVTSEAKAFSAHAVSCACLRGFDANRLTTRTCASYDEVSFFLRRAKIVDQDAMEEQVRLLAACMPAEYTAAADVVTIMGGLPLALDQAERILKRQGVASQATSLGYEQQQAHLLDRRGNFPGHHPHSVAMTFHLSMKGENFFSEDGKWYKSSVICPKDPVARCRR